MNDVRHHPSHWMAVAAASAFALLTLSEAHGQQSTGAAAVFEGRPAMAGAQAGQGPMAGPPQGGIGPQGSDGSRGLDLRKPSGLDAMPAVPRDPGLERAGSGELRPQRDRGGDSVRDSGQVRKQTREAGKNRKAANRVLRRAKPAHPVDQ